MEFNLYVMKEKADESVCVCRTLILEGIDSSIRDQMKKERNS